MNLSPTQILKGFYLRDPWISRFTIQGQVYGGDRDFENDPRVPQFFEAFPHVQNILELGSLEGAHSFQLARRPGVHVTAVEARPKNLEKARFVAGLLGVTNVTFVKADLEGRRLASFGRFDAVFASGILYHLPRPWELLDELRDAAPRVFLWTHYAALERATETVNGFPGHWYQEHGLDDPLSGLSPRSFWITRPSLIERLRKNGFEHIQLIADDRSEPVGPSATLAAWTEAP